jgi:hypothetical protein
LVHTRPGSRRGTGLRRNGPMRPLAKLGDWQCPRRRRQLRS